MANAQLVQDKYFTRWANRKRLLTRPLALLISLGPLFAFPQQVIDYHRDSIC
jgi:hypothetical protein